MGTNSTLPLTLEKALDLVFPVPNERAEKRMYQLRRSRDKYGVLFLGVSVAGLIIAASIDSGEALFGIIAGPIFGGMCFLLLRKTVALFDRYLLPAQLEVQGRPLPEGMLSPTMATQVFYWLSTIVISVVCLYLTSQWALDFETLGLALWAIFWIFLFGYTHLRWRIGRRRGQSRDSYV